LSRKNGCETRLFIGFSEVDQACMTQVFNDYITAEILLVDGGFAL
jgi:hypothetical protein